MVGGGIAIYVRALPPNFCANDGTLSFCPFLSLAFLAKPGPQQSPWDLITCGSYVPPLFSPAYVSPFYWLMELIFFKYTNINFNYFPLQGPLLQLTHNHDSNIICNNSSLLLVDNQSHLGANVLLALHSMSNHQPLHLIWISQFISCGECSSLMSDSYHL